MSEAIIVALITGGLALIGSIITSRKSAREIDHKLDKRVPVIEEQMKVTNHRLADLEGFHKHA